MPPVGDGVLTESRFFRSKEDGEYSVAFTLVGSITVWKNTNTLWQSVLVWSDMWKHVYLICAFRRLSIALVYSDMIAQLHLFPLGKGEIHACLTVWRIELWLGTGVHYEMVWFNIPKPKAKERGWLKAGIIGNICRGQYQNKTDILS